MSRAGVVSRVKSPAAAEEVQRLREEVSRCEEELSRHERDTQRLLEGVVHDLRSAERGIGTSLEILYEVVKEARNADTEPVFQRLVDAVARMNQILTGVSNYSLSLPSARHSFGRVPMESVLHSAVASLDREIRESNAKIMHGPLPEVSGDGERLRMLFRNLIENALKFHGDAAPEIDVQATTEGDDWVFTVKDNGIGIDPRYWTDLFTPFKRLHGSEIPGTGLGLAICRKILETHQGRIWIDSVRGQGTSFLFTLPRDSGMDG